MNNHTQLIRRMRREAVTNIVAVVSSLVAAGVAVTVVSMRVGHAPTHPLALLFMGYVLYRAWMAIAASRRVLRRWPIPAGR